MVGTIISTQYSVTGKVILVYNDAIATGTKDYVQITELLVEDKSGVVHTVKPRDVIKTIKQQANEN